MGRKRTQREAEVVAAHPTSNTVKADLELTPVNGDHTEKRVKKKKEQRRERVLKGENVKKSRPEIEAEVVNADSKDKKKKNEDFEGSNSALSKELPTVSIALPGSIIDNAQSLELATRLAGQIARAATIFRIDEVVVFDNAVNSQDGSDILLEPNLDENESGAAFLFMILKYMETPQYLRKSLFPMHKNLRFVGTLPPLDAPHHLRKHEWAPFREGVTLRDQHPKLGRTLVDVGLSKNVLIDQDIDPGKRVTVSMGTDRHMESDMPYKVVSTSTPRKVAGMYWGYKVRYAPNISSVFKDCPYKGGYDHIIGTSEHGISVRSSELNLPPFTNLLIAFGGLAGLEECIEEDSNLKGKNAHDIFDLYLNTCPHQGSRTIRTEEAIFISLQYFQEPINRVLGTS